MMTGVMLGESPAAKSPEPTEKTMTGRAKWDALRGDARELASSIREVGLRGTVERVRLAGRRRRAATEQWQDDDPSPVVSPDAPLGWRETLEAISGHYALALLGPVEWTAEEVIADIRRLVELSPDVTQDQRSVGAVHVDATRADLRQALATIEAMRSWPDSRALPIVVQHHPDDDLHWDALTSIPGVTLDRSQPQVSGGGSPTPSPTDAGSLVVTAGELPQPGWAELRLTPAPVRGQLVVSALRIPRPDRNSGDQDLYWLLRHARALGFGVVLSVAENSSADARYRWDLQRLGIAVTTPGRVPDHLAPHARQHAQVAVGLEGFDAWERVPAAGKRGPLLFVPLDLQLFAARSFEQLEAPFALGSSSAELERRVQQAVTASDLTAVISLDELEYLRHTGHGDSSRLLPMLRSDPDRTAVAPGTGQPRAVFVGGFKHPPNQLAVQWLVTEIWPLVRERIPEATLDVYGSHLEVVGGYDWASAPGVRLRGWYAAEADPYRGDVIAVAPLTYGGGVKGKVVTALGHGAVVVGTTFAAEGLPADVRQCVQVVDGSEFGGAEVGAAEVASETDAPAAASGTEPQPDPAGADAPAQANAAAAFAERIVALWADPDERRGHAEAGMRAYDAHFSETAGLAAVRDLLAELLPPQT